MAMEIVECENNLLFDCDMYATLRDKLIINPDIGTPIDIINNDSLRLNLMNLLSPYTTNNLNDAKTNQFNTHHKLALTTKQENELHKNVNPVS